jgi:DNA primase
MNSFRKERLPDARLFYEGHLGRLARPNSRGWAVASCPFHRSRSGKSFSVNVRTGGFHCFGCDARGGDVVDFVQLHDNCDFQTAARRLGAWSDVGLTREGRLQLAEAAREVERRRAAREEAEHAERRRRLALRDEIHAIAAIYQEASDRLSELRQGASPVYQDEEQHCWDILSLALEDLRMAETEYKKIGDAQ